MKMITAPTMVELIAKIYAHEGWRRREGESRTKRIKPLYDVKIDFKRERFTARKLGIDLLLDNAYKDTSTKETEMKTPKELRGVYAISSKLVAGDAFQPSSVDIIAQTGQLNVGEPVPEGWRVLTGNPSSSLVVRIGYRYEFLEEMPVERETIEDAFGPF